jgi:hypothetical protein
MRITPFLSSSSIVLACALGTAQSSDPAAARAQLQQGYALKQQGKCDEAVPHFLESVRLDRQPKALLNLADCEEKLGKLATAQAHFVEARDLAKAQGNDQLKGVAEQHLQALEKRMPKLVVRVAKDAPGNTIVLRDGVELGRVSLNVPLPTDPGRHTVVVRVDNIERKYDVTLTEAETKEIEVSPKGGETTAPTNPPRDSSSSTSIGRPSSDSASPSTEPKRDRPTDDAQAGSTGVPALRIGGFALGGLGVAGIVVGAISGFNARSKSSEAEGVCPTTGCGSEAHAQFEALRDEAIQARTLSIVGFAVGGAALVGGTILVLTNPSRNTQGGRTSITLSASGGHDRIALVAGGTW